MYIFLSLYFLVLIVSLHAFIHHNVRMTKQTRLFGFMDSMKKALESDPNLVPMENPGLSSSAKAIDVEFKGVKSAKIKAYAGQKLKDVATSAKVPIKYSCRKAKFVTVTNIAEKKSIIKVTGVNPHIIKNGISKTLFDIVLTISIFY